MSTAPAIEVDEIPTETQFPSPAEKHSPISPASQILIRQMNIIIVGAGEVGKHLAQSLSSQLHDITLIDRSEESTDLLREKLDATVVCENGTSATVLAEHNVADCDLFLAITRQDDTNLMAASIAKKMGAKKTIARVHASVERDRLLLNYQEHFGIDHLFSAERLSAVELTKFIRNPEGVVAKEIARGRIELRQLKVSPESDLLQKPLSSLDLPQGIRIAAIYRNQETIIPEGVDHLQAGDLITLSSDPAHTQTFLARVSPKIKQRVERNLFIFGGGEYALVLAEMLADETPRLKMRIMEKSKTDCDRLSRLLSDVDIIHGDAASRQQLREEQVGNADFFIAVSPDDEDNVMTCLQAKSLGAKSCLTLIHRPDLAKAIEQSRMQLGIRAVVSPRLAASQDLLRFVETEKFHEIADLKANIQALQLVLKENSESAGKRVSEIQWPKGGSLIGLVRGQITIVPSGKDELRAGDVVYFVVTPEARKSFVKTLAK